MVITLVDLPPAADSRYSSDVNKAGFSVNLEQREENTV